MAAMQTLAYDSLQKNPEKVEDSSYNSVLYNTKDVGVNLAVSFSCIVGCPICKIYLVDHGYRKFKEKIHF
ncbi:hypothetical protein SD332_19545, partial [Bacteroides fragilis]